MFQHHLSSSYWTLLAISLLAVAAISFMFGYTYRANTDLPLVVDANQSNVTGKILNQQIQDALQPKTGPEVVSAPSELHVYTGYVRAKSIAAITVEKPDATTDWPDSLTFDLEDTTAYARLNITTDSAGLPVNLEDALTLTDVTVGDIVTVYCNEDIRTADTLVATKVQILGNANKS